MHTNMSYSIQKLQCSWHFNIQYSKKWKMSNLLIENEWNGSNLLVFRDTVG